MVGCPEHGELVRQLALGRLDDAASAEAEAVVEECEHCAAWWQRETSPSDAVRAAVCDGLAELELPRHRRVLPYAVAAAAAAVLVGGGLLLRSPEPEAEPMTTCCTHEIVDGVYHGGVDGDLNGDGVRDAADLALSLQRSPSRS